MQSDLLEDSTRKTLGVGVAAVVLFITFGSLVAAGMPFLTALVGVGVGLAGVTTASGVVPMSSTAPILALMLGLAVGIDYALFIVSRHRRQMTDEGVGAGGIEDSIARAIGTAGSAVLMAGATVVIALAALSVVGGHRVPHDHGPGGAGTVAVTVLVALTLLPAALGMAGTRILPRREPGAAADDAAEPPVPFGARWAGFTTRFRVPVILGGLLMIGVVALPVDEMRLALPDDDQAPADCTQRQAFDLIATSFGPGFNGRLVVVVSSGDGSDTALVPVVPETGPTDEATEDLVVDIREQALAWEADVAVTGSTALGIDVPDTLTDALPVYLALVVGLSFVLLMLVFRSILVPLEATLGFLFSVSSSFGATVAVFQWGWLREVVGIDQAGPLISFLPLLLIGILFGLAMNYEVFLVSRMREEYVHTGDAQRAVRQGTADGARVVTAAAVSMISVFGGFVFVEDRR